MGWNKLSLAEQLGNIGSELHRALVWERRGDEEAKQHALERALDLIDKSLNIEKKSASLRELVRLREIISDIYVGSKVYKISLEQILQYCLPFAIISRNRLRNF